MPAALNRLRILEVGSGTAGAMAGMVLAENGAEVVKIEPPGGDPERGRPGFRIWHRGKKSAVLDLHAPGGRERFALLAAAADSLIECLRPGAAERLGIDYETLRPSCPRLVYASISGFGERGTLRDLPGYEGIVSARSGRMHEQPGFRDGPIFTPVPIACYGAGLLAAQGLLAALYRRGRSGRGQRLHTSLLAALTVYDMTIGPGNRTQRVKPGQVFGVMEVAFMTAPTRDGRFIQMCSRQPHLYRNWLKALGLEELLDAPDLQHMPDLFPSEERMREVVKRIRDKMRERSADEWMEIFSANDIGGDPFLTAAEFLEHPQAVLNGRAQAVVDPEVGRTLQVGPLASFSETPAAIGAPAPQLGQHTQEVLAEAAGPRRAATHPTDARSGPVTGASGLGGESAARAEPAALDPAGRGGPLEGVTVVECGYFYATPFAATLLAEAGARVIKIEPSAGDPGRRNWTQTWSKSMVGKESVVADLKTPEGREIVHALVRGADLFIHNFRPGTPERLRIDYPTLSGLNPRLVYVYGSCFGSAGPWSHKAGFHSSPNAICGCGIIESGRGNPPRNRTFADPAAALATAACALVGLHARERTGRGQYVETTMLTSMAYAVSEWSLQYAGKPDRLPDPGQHGFGALHRLYPTADGWLYLECHRPREWRALCAEVDPALAEDPRFADATARARNDAELTRELAERLAGRPAQEWESPLQAAGAPAVRADGIDHERFMLGHPHCRENRIAVEADQPGTPLSWRSGPVIEFEGAPTPVRPAGELGARTQAVLRELGYAEARIAELAERGVTRAVGHGLPD